MPLLIEPLDLARCPHCRVDRPNIQSIHTTQSNNFSSNNKRHWRIYRCHRCGGLITAASKRERGEVDEIYPQPIRLDESLPEKARIFLDQAINSLHAPAGSIMLSASS